MGAEIGVADDAADGLVRPRLAGIARGRLAQRDVVLPHRDQTIARRRMLALAAAQYQTAAIDQIGADLTAAQDVGAADKAGDEFRARPLVDLLGRADLLDPAEEIYQ